MARLRKLFFSKVGLYCLISVTLIAGIYRYWGIPFRSAYRKYSHWTQQKNALEQRINILRLQIAYKKHFIRKLMTDRAFREYVSREQLKYLKDNEYVVFFKQGEEIR